MRRSSESGEIPLSELHGRESVYWLTTNIFLITISIVVMVQSISLIGEIHIGSMEAVHYWRLSSIALPGITTVFCLYLTGKRKELRREQEAARKLQQEMDRVDGQMREALRTSEAKDQFMANLSHEIRTPITSILGFSEILLDNDVSPEEQKSALNAVHQNGKHLHQLVTDLLDFSEMNSGAMSVAFEICSPEEVVRKSAALCEPDARRKGLLFDVAVADNIPETWVTDPLRVRQILINLISNAVKFTDRGRVWVSAALSPADPSILDIDVSDTGSGIDESLWGVLFDPFVQGDGSSTRRHGGTGLGLAICRHLASLLGGTIELNSALGEGTTFSLHLPVVTGAEPENAGTGDPAANGAGLREPSTRIHR